MKKIKMINGLLIVLSLMIFWDWTLHLHELITGTSFFVFPNRIIYTYFWSFYWGIAFILSLILFKKINGNKKE